MLNNNSQAKLGCQLHLMLLMFSHTMDVSPSSSLFSSFLFSPLFSSLPCSIFFLWPTWRMRNSRAVLRAACNADASIAINIV